MRVRAKLTLRNEIVIAERERLGMNQTEFAKMANVRVETVCRIETLRFDRVSDRDIQRVAAAIGCLPEDVVPTDLRRQSLTSSVSVVRDVETTSLLGMSQPILMVDQDAPMVLEELRVAIDTALNTLTFRQREIVKLRLGLDGKEPMTLEEVGRVFSIHRERVRQIEQKAYRRLRNPSVSQGVLNVTEGKE